MSKDGMLQWIKQMPDPENSVLHPSPLRFAIGTTNPNGAPGVWKVVEMTAYNPAHNRGESSNSMCMYRLSDNTLVVCNNTLVECDEFKDGVVPRGMLFGIEIDIESYIIELIRNPTTVRPIVQKYF